MTISWLGVRKQRRKLNHNMFLLSSFYTYQTRHNVLFSELSRCWLVDFVDFAKSQAVKLKLTVDL